MKRKHILAIAITTCLLFIAGILVWFELSREEAAQTKPEVESKVTPKPSPESDSEMDEHQLNVEIIEKKDCTINGRKYNSIRYSNVNGKMVIIEVLTGDECLVIPSEIEGVKVTQLGFLIDELIWINSYETEQNWNRIRKKFKKVIIPEGVTHVGDYACQGMKAEKVIFPSTLQKLGMAFVDGKIGKVIMKSDTVDLENSAFYCSNLKKISFPQGYSGSIESLAFSYTSIKEVCWPDGGKVEGSAFYYCKDLEKVVFPENQKVIRIPELAFWRCDNLKELVFPASTGKVIIENNVSAENTLGNSMPPVLRFEGKDTKLQGLKKKVKGKDLVMTQKIIAPKGSEAIKYAKKAYRLKRVSDKKSVRKSIKDYADGNGVLDWWDKREKVASGVEFAPLLYEEVG